MVLLPVLSLCLTVKWQLVLQLLLLLHRNLGLLSCLLFVHLVDAGRAVKHIWGHSEGLAHFFEEICGFLHSDICRQICVLESQLVIDPGGELLDVVSALVALVSEDH